MRNVFRPLKRLPIALIAVIATASAVVPGSAMAVPAPLSVQGVASEAAEETAEEAAENAEDAAAAPLDQAAVPPRVLRIELRIERLKHRIARDRAALRIVRLLPHTTTRWLEHRPKKKQDIKTCRARIRVLRLLAEEARG